MEKKKKLTIALFVQIVLAFLWIGLVVILTAGKDFADFSHRDWTVFAVFIGMELVTLIATFWCAARLGKLNRASQPPMPKPASPTKVEKRLKRRSFALSVLAFLLVLALICLGIAAKPAFGESGWLIAIPYSLLALCALASVISLLRAKAFRKQIEEKKVEEILHLLLTNRELAQQTAEEKRTNLLRLIRQNDLLAVALALAAGGIAFFTGLYSANGFSYMELLAIMLMIVAFSRIRFQVPKAVFTSEMGYVEKSDFPELYALAEKARDTLGLSGTIHIALLPNENAGIWQNGSIYSIQLGTMLLSVTAEEEIYAVLLHEFAHIANTVPKEERINRFAQQPDTNVPTFLRWLAYSFFLYTDTVFSYEHFLYSDSLTVSQEAAADRAMITYGDPMAAASVLRKLKYTTLFAWEEENSDFPSFYESETQPRRLKENVDQFQQALSHRKADWDRLLNQEILSRSASHPTVKMRLEAFGIDSADLFTGNDRPAYRRECEKALECAQERIWKEEQEDYAQHRKDYYLTPKKQVEDWEQAGQALIAEEYPDIVNALITLGRHQDAMALCDRAMQELPDAAACEAVYQKACYLLHAYDDRGIDLMYHAIESNQNYTESGTDLIGEYCCLTGNQEKLDIFREKFLQIAQTKLDVYDEIGELRKNDKLSRETLPEGMLEGILNHLQTIDSGAVEKVYLVKKTITEDFSTSDVILQFREDTGWETRNEIYHKMFRYLDTSTDWQFALFDYAEVKAVKPERIEGSLVFQRTKS